MSESSKLVSSSILGLDVKTVIINNKVYTIYPPTIAKLAGAGFYLSDIDNLDTVKDILTALSNADNLAHALSMFIKGDDSLFEELREAPFDEIVSGLESCYSLLSVENFLKLSTLAKNVASLIAKQKL